MKEMFTGIAAAGGLSALLLTGVTTTAHAATSATPPSVVAFNQKIDGGSVTVDYAYLPTKGYAVVYGADKDGNPVKQPLGVTELEPGDHRGVKIKLNSEPQSGSKLWISLYSDKDAKAGFDRAGDSSFWAEALPLENQILVK